MSTSRTTRQRSRAGLRAITGCGATLIVLQAVLAPFTWWAGASTRGEFTIVDATIAAFATPAAGPTQYLAAVAFVTFALVLGPDEQEPLPLVNPSPSSVNRRQRPGTA